MLWQTKSVASQSDKKQRQLEKTIDELENRLSGVSAELRNSEEQVHSLTADLAKAKMDVEEESANTEQSRRETKKLAGKF